MSSLPVFALASQQAQWLSIRQAAVANNIANISTPGYRATDVKPFDSVLQETQFQMRATNARHVELGKENMLERADAEMTVSGSPVRIENEVMKASEIRRDYEINTAITKAFHRMLMAASKG